jgi:copper chaperone CopZ
MNMERVVRDSRRQGRRTTLLGLVSAFVLFGALLGANAFLRAPREAAYAAASDAQTTTATIPIQGMSCAACVARVKKALKSIDGVRDVEVRLAQRDARVRYVRARVAPERLAAAINKLGYKAGTPKAGG